MTVELKESELLRTGHTAASFRLLRFPEQRWLASSILRDRPDNESQFAAEMMERANPNFNDFVVLSGV